MRRQREDVIGDLDDEVEDFSVRTADVHDVVGGVTIPWLMKAFGMGRQTVTRKLIGCQPIGQGKHNTPVYSLPDAASFLVKPRVDLEKYLKEIGPKDLPVKLQDAYWAAKNKEQRYREKAGELWRTEKVIEVFSEVLQQLRTKLQLIPDRIERESGLTETQRQSVSSIVDSIQDDMHKSILEFAKSQVTPSQLGEMDEEEEDELP